MNTKKLMKVTYYDPNNNIRLTGYSDTVVWDDKGQPTLMVLRFGGCQRRYEIVRKRRRNFVVFRR